ncbi:MAG: hypothetical protein E7333_01175 [Clostridiales bacterium]|nr:hypothetical protein [Clostridiales bacterium]
MAHPFFPNEVISDIPRIILTGDQRFLIEQHKGLTTYQPTRVVFRSGAGRVQVTGSDMRLKRYTASEAVVIGRIDTVTVGDAHTA